VTHRGPCQPRPCWDSGILSEREFIPLPAEEKAALSSERAVLGDKTLSPLTRVLAEELGQARGLPSLPAMGTPGPGSQDNDSGERGGRKQLVGAWGGCTERCRTCTMSSAHMAHTCAQHMWHMAHTAQAAHTVNTRHTKRAQHPGDGRNGKAVAGGSGTHSSRGVRSVAVPPPTSRPAAAGPGRVPVTPTEPSKPGQSSRSRNEEAPGTALRLQVPKWALLRLRGLSALEKGKNTAFVSPQTSGLFRNQRSSAAAQCRSALRLPCHQGTSLTAPVLLACQELVVGHEAQAGGQAAVSPPRVPLCRTPRTHLVAPRLSEAIAKATRSVPTSPVTIASEPRFLQRPLLPPRLGECFHEERRGRGVMGLPHTVQKICGTAKHWLRSTNHHISSCRTRRVTWLGYNLSPTNLRRLFQCQVTFR